MHHGQNGRAPADRGQRLAANRKAALGAITAILLGSAAGTQYAKADCRPALIAMRTAYPSAARQTAQQGVVTLTFQLDASGRTKAIGVARSSGHFLLDRAAVDSASTTWRFDVAGCAALDLQRNYRIDVQFDAPPLNTLWASIDWQAVARAKRLKADARCETVDATEITTVFACPENVVDMHP